MKRCLQVVGRVQLRPEGRFNERLATGGGGGDRQPNSPFSMPSQKNAALRRLRSPTTGNVREELRAAPSHISDLRREAHGRNRAAAQHDPAARTFWKGGRLHRGGNSDPQPAPPRGRPAITWYPPASAGGECSPCPSHPNCSKQGCDGWADLGATTRWRAASATEDLRRRFASRSSQLGHRGELSGARRRSLTSNGKRLIRPAI